MSFQAFAAAFSQSTAIIDTKTGLLTKDGRALILALFNRTGAGTGIVPVVSSPLTATGTTQATALGLTADWNDVETVTAGANGVIVPVGMKPGNDIWVFNGNATNLNVYPFVGASIDQLGPNAPFVLAQNKLRCFQCWTTTLFRSYGN